MITVLLAEDAHMVRGALAALLNMEPDISVTAEVASGDAIVPAALECHPNVAVIDIDLPGIDGLTAAAELRTVLPSCRVLILTSLSRPGAVRRALDARVDGFMLKDSPSEKLADAVRQVSVGRRVINGELALTAWDTEGCPLTNREIEILKLAAAGENVGDIAAHLFLSTGTVRNYLTTAVTKLGARNRLDAIRVATEAGWL